ncbi:hypothetical protein NIES4102_36440 [Chondrocystis sp. NIES-4102]|nr:hypothetical protein NIES4102_36440 [Chondrocystis sp. NIES-4102]
MYLNQQTSASKIVISIPINLKCREEIVEALFDQYGTNYLFLEDIFLEVTTKQYCFIKISDRDLYSFTNHGYSLLTTNKIKYTPRTELANSFAFLGQNKISENVLKEIDNYQQIVYLTSLHVGYNYCLQIAKFSQIILSLGGIALKVESAGIAHQADHWLAHYHSQDIFDIYSLFVVLIEGDDYYYSCGMHNFGMADVIVDLEEEMSLAIYVLNVFNYYRLTEFPIIKQGQTFQPDITSPIYQMHSRSNIIADNNLLFNPYGQWHLKRFSS